MDKLMKNKKVIIWTAVAILFLIGLGIGIKRTIEEEKANELGEKIPVEDKVNSTPPEEIKPEKDTKKSEKEIAKNFAISAYALNYAANDLNNTLSEIGEGEYSRRAYILIEEMEDVEVPDIESLSATFENYKSALIAYGDALVQSLIEGIFVLEERVEYTRNENLNFFECQSALLDEVDKLQEIYDLDVLGSDEVMKEFERLKTLYDENNGNEVIPTEPTKTRKEEALQKIKLDVEAFGFSYAQAVRGLEEDGFTNEEATYAGDNCGVDWNEQAVRTAKLWRKWEPNWTYEKMYEHLKLEEFTDEQAEYGANAVFED